MSTTPPPPSAWRQQQPDWVQPPAEQPPAAEAYPPPSAYPPPAYAGEQPGYQYAAASTGQPAEWWRRVLAIVLDGVVLGIPYFLLTAALGIETAETDPITGDVSLDVGALAAVTVVSVILSLLYSGLLDGSQRGQSVGKMALGIQVRDVTTGGPIGFGRAALRRFVYTILWYLFVLPGLLNGLSPLWDARKQAWHDKAVGSIVVMKTP